MLNRIKNSIAIVLIVSNTLTPLFASNLSDAKQSMDLTNYKDAIEKATAALKEGNHNPSELKDLYRILGESYSGQYNNSGDEKDKQSSELYFQKLLALDPEYDTDSVSPKLNGPLNNASAVIGKEDGIKINVDFNKNSKLLVLTVSDKAKLSKNVKISVRGNPLNEFETIDLETKSELAVKIKDFYEPADKNEAVVEYYYQLVDEFGNTILEKGTNLKPEQITVQVSKSLGGEPKQKVENGKTVNNTSYYVTSGILAGLGIVSFAVSGIFYASRESSAEKWNDNSQCLKTPNQTRAEQCASIKDDIDSAESTMTITMGLGGAFLLGSLVTLLITPGSNNQETVSNSFSCGNGPGYFGISCGGNF